MRHIYITLAVIACAINVSCVPMTTLAPGAEQVRITKNAPDVAGCTAVGNLKAPVSPQGVPDATTSDREFRNLTIGFGGNVAFVTTAVLGVPVEGIAYRCP